MSPAGSPVLGSGGQDCGYRMSGPRAHAPFRILICAPFGRKVLENIVAIWGGSVTERRSKSSRPFWVRLFTAGGVEGLGMKVAGYVHPGIASFVPIADSDRLQGAWTDEASPIVEAFSSPNGQAAAALAESRRLIAAIHGSIKWQNWVSKPSFGNVTASTAKQGGVIHGGG